MQLLSAYLPVALGCLAILVLASKVQNYLEAQAFAQKNGTQPARKLPQWEQWVGIQNVLEMLRAARNHGILELGLRRYTAMGKTFETKALGRSFTHTIDPENIKTVLSTNFKDFAVGQRIDTLGPLLGSGIFTTDGAAWEHSRVSCCSGLLVLFSIPCFRRLLWTVVGSSSWPSGTGVTSRLSCTCHAPTRSLSPGKEPLASAGKPGPRVLKLHQVFPCPTPLVCLVHSVHVGLMSVLVVKKSADDRTRVEVENCPFGIPSFPDWSQKAYTHSCITSAGPALLTPDPHSECSQQTAT